MVSPDPLQVDPALEELIHELARDPRSTLLRMERPARPARVTDSWEALSRWTPGLTAAEKELLDVHRAEFATLLIRRWLVENELRPPPRLFMVTGHSSSRPAVPLDPREFATSALGASSGVDESGELTSLLDSAIHLSEEQQSRLMVTAVEVFPTTVTRLHYVHDLVRTGQLASASVLLRSLLSVEQRPHLRSYCWENLAFSYGKNGDQRKIQSCYRRAAAIEDPRIDSLSWWMLVSAQNGDLKDVLQAAEYLDGLYAPEDPRIAKHIAVQKRTREEGEWLPTALARHIRLEVIHRLGGASRRILDVLA